jgi:tetratricopeptide (TPR) repeat protein
MFARFFHRPRPQSTREMIRVLRAAGQFSDPSERSEYDQAADALDRILQAAEKKSDRPTRDAFSYALGRAELDLGDKLAELIEVSKETHIIVQGVQGAQVKQEAAAGALWAAFQSFAESLTQWREEIERWRGQVDATLNSYKEFAVESRTDRAKHATQLGEVVRRMGEIEAFIIQIKQLMDRSPTPEQAEQYRAFLDHLMREREAGD